MLVQLGTIFPKSCIFIQNQIKLPLSLTDLPYFSILLEKCAQEATTLKYPILRHICDNSLLLQLSFKDRRFMTS